MQQHQQQHHARARGLLVLSNKALLGEVNASTEECTAQLGALLRAVTVDEQALLMKKLGASVAKRSPEERSGLDVLRRAVLHLLFEEPERESSAIHLFVPLARMAEALYASSQHVEEHVTRWVSRLAEKPAIGAQAWMQLAALLAGPHEQLTQLACKHHVLVVRFFLARGPVLAAALSGEDDHAARTAGRETEAMMSCARDYFPKVIALNLLEPQTRAELARVVHALTFACRWTQIQCGVGGMALAVLEQSDASVIATLNDETLDVGARLCLCRGICNSRNHDQMHIIVGHVWPLLQRFLEHADVSKMSTTNRHFLICALDSMARCPPLSDKDVILKVVNLVVVHFESSVHAPLDTAMEASFQLLKKHCDDSAAKTVFNVIWNGGRAPLFGPLDHFLQAFGASLFTESDNFPELLISACGDVRMKTGASRVFASFVAIGGVGWEKQLRAAMLRSRNKTLHLCVAQHLIPIVFRSLTVEVAVKRLLDGVGDDNEMLRLAVASHLGNQKRQTLAMVVPDLQLVKNGLVSGNAWLRRYALETAVAMQDGALVSHYIANLAKEHSQSQRSSASGALCRWWKTKAGAASNPQECEDRLARNLYVGSPSSRQGTVSSWLATRKSFVSAGRASELQTMLVEMLCSRYDANRGVAATILAEQFRGTGILAADAPERGTLMKLSMQTIKCIRIRISDGGARLFTLLHSVQQLPEALETALQMLDKHVEIGQRDFSKLSSHFTLHGPLLVLRYLLLDPKAVFSPDSTQRLLRGCRQVMKLCSPFVCDNTLEGKSDNVKIPFGAEEDEEEVDDEDEDELSSGSHVRVCAWRGVRETCLVIGTAMQRLLPMMRLEEDVCTTTDALLAIVLKSKHRGALENASIGLEQTCMACLKSVGPPRLLPQQWLERVLAFDAKSMGTVRRSAGIPYAICVILRSEWVVCSKRDANTPLVSLSMKQLLGGISVNRDEEEKYLVMDESRVGYYRTQVHHLNILRHVLRDSSLADLLRPYLEELLLLSLKMWNHKEWSIRNSASLLFAAAMRKLDPSTTPTSESGEHVAQLKLKKFEFSLFRSSFPGLMDHVSLVLERHASNLQLCHDIFSDLFPMLLILKKLHVAVADSFSEKLYGYCIVLSGHRNQMIRHGSAKAAAALAEPLRWAPRAAECISGALDVLQTSTNTAYGMLYCALELGINNRHSADFAQLLLSEKDTACVPVLCSLRCPPVAAVMLQVLQTWRAVLPKVVEEQIAVDSASFKSRSSDYVLFPGFQKLVVGNAEKPLAPEVESQRVVENGLCLARSSKGDLLQLVVWLDSDQKKERKAAAKEFQVSS